MIKLSRQLLPRVTTLKNGLRNFLLEKIKLSVLRDNNQIISKETKDLSDLKRPVNIKLETLNTSITNG